MFLFSEEPFSCCLLCSCLGNRNPNDENVEGFILLHRLSREKK